ncbi:hypothetical protein [Nonomuraea solani]|uniref:hypothetical protein n=1 Tax=Nonomuraea solani TaxID=1144553 RepID=UPI001357399C|nr:hypothetical protein [Nonomuraea solani]
MYTYLSMTMAMKCGTICPAPEPVGAKMPCRRTIDDLGSLPDAKVNNAPRLHRR